MAWSFASFWRRIEAFARLRWETVPQAEGMYVMKPGLNVLLPSWAVALLCLCAAIVNGCAKEASMTTFNSRVERSASPIKRLLVLASVTSSGFSARMYEVFRAGLTNRLATCGVPSKVLSGNSSEDPLQRIKDSTAEFEPTATLVIQRAGGAVIRESTGYMGTDRTTSALLFQLEMIDTSSAHRTWLARSRFDTRKSNTDVETSAVEFATSIVSRLRDDGMLLGCPTSGWPAFEPPPHCADVRKRILEQADASDNDRLRQLAPTCDPELE